MNGRTLLAGVAFLYIGIDVFLHEGRYNGYYHHYFDYTESHRYFGAVIILVGGWFLGRARG